MAQPYQTFRLAAPVSGGIPWQVQLVPNPTHEGSQLLLNLPSSGVLDFWALDATGRQVTLGREEVSNSGFKKVELMSSAWAAGTYSVCLRWQGKHSTEFRTIRLVKIAP
jgi:hypothetical protein